LHSMNKNLSLVLIAVNAQFVLPTVNFLYCRLVVAFVSTSLGTHQFRHIVSIVVYEFAVV